MLNVVFLWPLLIKYLSSTISIKSLPQISNEISKWQNNVNKLEQKKKCSRMIFCAFFSLNKNTSNTRKSINFVFVFFFHSCGEINLIIFSCSNLLSLFNIFLLFFCNGFTLFDAKNSIVISFGLSFVFYEQKMCVLLHLSSWAMNRIFSLRFHQSSLQLVIHNT